jgi:hypothetical protein
VSPRRIAVLAGFLVFAFLARADEQPKLNDELSQELLAMMKADQDARFKLIEVMKKGNLNPDKVKEKSAVPEAEAVAELDKKHTQRMKQIIEQHGWPGKSLVGVQAANAAWLLVQHADQDRAFQKKCLPLLEAAVKKGEATGQQLAYLTDRVLCGEGKKQRYGTQLKQEGDKMVPQPIEDEANVDKRRAEIGLQPLAEYIKFATEMYKGKPAEKK